MQFINAETDMTPTHVGVLAVLDPATARHGRVSAAQLRTLIASRLHLVPALRRRLHPVPGGLDLPYWVDLGDEVDLARHVHEIDLPRPGTDAELGELVGRLAESPLDRELPLWQAYLFNGLTGGRQALYAKVHHAVVDGVSGAEVLAVLFDLSGVPAAPDRPAAPLPPEPPPDRPEMLRRAAEHALRRPWRAARALPSALPALRRLPGAVGLRPAPRSVLNRQLTGRREFAFVSLPLETVTTAKRSIGGTVNDVVLAMCTTALRGWLAEAGELPDSALVAGIPVSIRTPGQVGSAGNQISLMLAALPTNVADPVRRLAALRESVGVAKEHFARRPPHLLHHTSAVLPQLMHGAATRALVRATRLAPPLFNLFVSNVPGSPVPLFAAGTRVLATYPVSVVSQVGGGVNITVMSYDGHLDVGVISCPDVAPGAWRLVEHLRHALGELTEPTAGQASEIRRRPPARRRHLSLTPGA